MNKPTCGVLAGEPEIVGTRCADGGTCHHRCLIQCSRRHSLGCEPLSASGLALNWAEVSSEEDGTISLGDLGKDIRFLLQKDQGREALIIAFDKSAKPRETIYLDEPAQLSSRLMRVIQRVFLAGRADKAAEIRGCLNAAEETE